MLSDEVSETPPGGEMGCVVAKGAKQKVSILLQLGRSSGPGEFDRLNDLRQQVLERLPPVLWA